MMIPDDLLVMVASKPLCQNGSLRCATRSIPLVSNFNPMLNIPVTAPRVHSLGFLICPSTSTWNHTDFLRPLPSTKLAALIPKSLQQSTQPTLGTRSHLRWQALQNCKSCKPPNPEADRLHYRPYSSERVETHSLLTTYRHTASHPRP